MSDRPMHTVPGAFEKLTALYAAGEQAIDEGRLDDAVAAFTEGIGIDDHFRQRYVTMYAMRAFALQRAGRLAEAIADYDEALTMGEPEVNQAQYHFHRGMCFEGLAPEGDEARPANVAEAIAAYGRSIALHDDHPGPFHKRGQLRVHETDDHEGGVADLTRLLGFRDTPSARQSRGFGLHSLGRFDEALADFAKAHELDPDDAYPHYMVACIHAKRNDVIGMYDAIEAALQLDPSYKSMFDDEDFDAFKNEARFQALVAE